MRLGPYRIHKMIQDLMRDPEKAAQFALDQNPIFEAYGITSEEATLLRRAQVDELVFLGVHPNLQLKLRRLLAWGKPSVGPGPIDHYRNRLLGNE